MLGQKSEGSRNYTKAPYLVVNPRGKALKPLKALKALKALKMIKGDM